MVTPIQQLIAILTAQAELLEIHQLELRSLADTLDLHAQALRRMIQENYVHLQSQAPPRCPRPD